MNNSKIILPIVVAILVFQAIYLSRSNRHEILDHGVVSTVKVLNVIKKSKGITTSEKVARIVYDTEDGKIEHSVPFQPKMEVGKCYEILYSRDNVKNIKIDVSKEKDCLDL
jgi:hypothetical protein